MQDRLNHFPVNHSYPPKSSRWAPALGLLAALAANPATADSSWIVPLEDACDSGNTARCLDVATAYATGQLQEQTIKVDKAKSQQWVRKGLRLGEQKCQGGSATDCYTLGLAYFEGLLVAADIPRGLQNMQKSCKGGYEKACIWLKDSGLPAK